MRFAPMANSSTPNSTPATGRTSTTSSRRSKKQNSVAALLTGVFGLVKADPPRALRFFSAGRWTFSFLRRVKGAWWPSRSSKPSSVRKNRGRFDSCPLRSAVISRSETTARPRRSLGEGGSRRYTPASSKVFELTSTLRSDKMGSCGKTCRRACWLNFEAHPAHDESEVSFRICSRDMRFTSF